MVPRETNGQARNRQVRDSIRIACSRRSTIIRRVSAKNVALVREVMALMNASVTDREATRGVVVEQRSAVIWTLRDGKVLGLETEFAPEEALRAAGVPE